MSYIDKDKQRAYQRAWLHNRKRAFYKDKCCVKCGSKEQLELDHINPAEKVTHRVWSWTEAKRNIEIAKCQVLCKACHLEKTLDEQKQRKLIESTY